MSMGSLASQPRPMPTTKGPVLVTGVPYSGTTWMGHQLCDACDLAYFHEPWNPNPRLVGYGRPFAHHYAFVTDRNASRHAPSISRLMAMRPRVRWSNLFWDRSMLAREIQEFRQRRADRLAGRRALWKDPIALLSSGWIARRLDAVVLLMIRHPLSFVSSCMARGGATKPSGLSWLLGDDDFMAAHGNEFHDDLERIDAPGTRPLERWAMTWRILMSVATQELQPLRDRVVIARHEDCLEHPIELLSRIAGRLGLPLRADPAAVVAMHREVHAHQGRQDRFDHAADSVNSTSTLDARDRAMILSITGPLASAWYEDIEVRETGTRAAWSALVA